MTREIARIDDLDTMAYVGNSHDTHDRMPYVRKGYAIVHGEKGAGRLVKVADRDGPHVYSAKKYALSTWMAMITLKADELPEESGGTEGLAKILGELEEILQMQVVQVRWAYDGRIYNLEGEEPEEPLRDWLGEVALRTGDFRGEFIEPE